METTRPGEHPVLKKMVQKLTQVLGDRLSSIVLYGSATRGDFHEGTSDFNLLIVLRDLHPGTLELLTDPVLHWERQRQPAPLIFSGAMVIDAADVFPIEFLDIKRYRKVLHGPDPFESLKVDPSHLRLQCERELREKMMRLREGYIECHKRPRRLKSLLTDSYTTFVALFRGCLHLLGGEVPVHNVEVVSAFCDRAGLDPTPFEDVDRLKRGESVAGDPKEIFSRYYGELTKAVGAVDRFEERKGGES